MTHSQRLQISSVGGAFRAPLARTRITDVVVLLGYMLSCETTRVFTRPFPGQQAALAWVSSSYLPLTFFSWAA